MNYLQKRKLIKSSFEIPVLGFGSAPLRMSNKNINNQSSDILINNALNLGLNYFDTAPWYGLGRCEHRLGSVLRETDRNKFIISTKVGRILKKNKPDRKSVV